MNRVMDYIRFAVSFMGLGYIVLWPLVAHDNAITPFEGSLVCGDRSYWVLAAICDPAPILRLSPGLHLIGMFSAIYVLLQFLLRRFRRMRRVPAVELAAPTAEARMQDVIVRPSGRKPAVRSLRTVRPRAHFGLRGLPD